MVERQPSVFARISATVYRNWIDAATIIAGTVVVIVAQFSLTTHEPLHDEPISVFGGFALVVGFVALTIGTAFFSARLRRRTWLPALPRGFGFRSDVISRVVFAIGVAAMTLLALRLLGGSKSGDDLWIWLVSLIGVVYPFLPRMKRLRVALRAATRAISPVDFGIVGVLAAIFLVINLGDLDDWYYYAIGDEYAVWELVYKFAADGISDPFSQIGVYDHHPRFGMIWKSALMHVFGIDYFGWKSSSVLLGALTIPGVYWAGCLLNGRVAGATAAAVFAFSHYVFALSHGGFNWIDSLLPSVYAVAFFTLGMRSRSAALLVIAGALAGICFYANFSARIMMPILVLFLIVGGGGTAQVRLRGLLQLAIGFAWAVSPLFIVNGTAVVTKMVSVVVGGQEENIDATLLEQAIDNIWVNGVAFHWIDRNSHYVSGGLLDPLSGVLAVVAVALVLGRIRTPTSSLLFIWLAVAFVATAVASPYERAAITRLYPLMPPIALAIGVFVADVIWPVEIRVRGVELTRFVARGKLVTVVILLAAGVLMLTLNLQRFTQTTPAVFRVNPAAVSVGAMESDDCNIYPWQQIAFVGSDTHLVRRILDALDADSVVIYPADEPEPPDSPKFFETGAESEVMTGNPARFGCIIFTRPGDDASRDVMEALTAAMPNARLITFSDRSEKSTVAILARR